MSPHDPPGTCPRCAALDMDGRRCRRIVVDMVRYHGDPELYGSLLDRSEPQWVVVGLCLKHSGQPKPKRRPA